MIFILILNLKLKLMSSLTTLATWAKSCLRAKKFSCIPFSKLLQWMMNGVTYIFTVLTGTIQIIASILYPSKSFQNGPNIPNVSLSQSFCNGYFYALSIKMRSHICTILTEMKIGRLKDGYKMWEKILLIEHF